MFQLLDYAKSFMRQSVPEDGVVADFTMGNGYDTVFLSRLVPKGKVYAFDIQKAAVESTSLRLVQEGITNAVLINDSHANANQYIKEELDGGMFNLGWLPGGDKACTTLRESTLPAVFAAIDMLKGGASLVISVYPGHEEGRLEGELLSQELSKLDKKKYCTLFLRLINSPDAPYVITVEKYK